MKVPAFLPKSDFRSMRLRLVVMRIDNMPLLISSFKRLNVVCSLKESVVDNISCFGQYTFLLPLPVVEKS